MLSSRKIQRVCCSPQLRHTAPDHLADLEEEIKQLESSNGDKARLAELKAELEKINKKKEEYVKEHPEQRNLVYRRRRKQNDADAKPETKEPVPQKRNLFNKKGLPRHPERSIYYDPVMNPYGVPPPGMPYMERRECFDCILLH